MLSIEFSAHQDGSGLKFGRNNGEQPGSQSDNPRRTEGIDGTCCIIGSSPLAILRGPSELSRRLWAAPDKLAGGPACNSSDDARSR